MMFSKDFSWKRFRKEIQNSIFDKKAQPTYNSFCVTISPTLTRDTCDTNTFAERTWEEPPSPISDGYLVASNRENQNQYNWKFETISNSVGTSYLTSSARNQQLHQAAELKTKLLSWPPLLGRRQSKLSERWNWEETKHLSNLKSITNLFFSVSSDGNTDKSHHRRWCWSPRHRCCSPWRSSTWGYTWC